MPFGSEVLRGLNEDSDDNIDRNVDRMNKIVGIE